MADSNDSPRASESNERGSAGCSDCDCWWLRYPQIFWVFAGCGLFHAVDLVWTLAKNPAMTYAALTGQPYDFYDAVSQLQLAPIEHDELVQTSAIGMPIAAGIVISETSLRAYDLGPSMELEGISGAVYPQDDFEIELWDWRVHSRDRNGQLIAPLYDWLTSRSDRLKALLGHDVDLSVVIASDQSAPFDVSRMVMFTAGQAYHSEFSFVRDSVAGPRLMPSDLPQIGPADPEVQ